MCIPSSNTILPSSTSHNVLTGKHLVTSTAGLGDDTLELINLGLGAAEGTKTLLCELAGTLVLGVAEQLNNAALVWGKASIMLILRRNLYRRIDAYPETSLTISRTKAVRLLK